MQNAEKEEVIELPRTTEKKKPVKGRTHANPKCRDCEGKGKIRYHFAEDITKIAPCPTCFPNNKEAQEMAKRFHQECLDEEMSYL